MERDIERYLIKRVKQMGGKAYKWTSPGNVGVPDRIVLLPDGVILFVECKASGLKPRASQRKRISEIEALGWTVHVVDSKAAVDEVLR